VFKAPAQRVLRQHSLERSGYALANGGIEQIYLSEIPSPPIMADAEIAKTLSSLAAPLVSAVIDTWVKPLLQQWRKERALNAELYDFAVAESLRGSDSHIRNQFLPGPL
jgi:hypothetical protein